MVENVIGNKPKDIDKISEILAVKPLLIDSALFSAQERKRYYWTNIPVAKLPANNPLVLKDILDNNIDEKFFYSQDYDYHGDDKRVCATLHINGNDILKRVYNPL